VKLNSNVRNVIIIIVLAAIVACLSAGRTAATVVTQAISLGFLAAIVWIATRLYREHRTAVYSLGTRRRWILYTALGVAALTLTATDRLWNTSGLGAIAWIVLIAGAAYALYAVYRSTKEY